MHSTWSPSASLENLKHRAAILNAIRAFFAARQVLEVETPVLCHASVTDPHIQSIPARWHQRNYYLQTSPEYAMKRLLAAGIGDIYQLTKSFRLDEVGRFHNPEFTMLEWYRVNYDHHQLMDEMDALLQTILHTQAAERISYADLFLSHLNCNPLAATCDELKELATKHHIQMQGELHDKDSWLHLLMSHCIEPQLGKDRPCFVYDFPASQAALARIQATNPPVASRFEVYVNGVELANGFHELQDAREQRERFEANVREREQFDLPFMPIDHYFLAALEAGLPDCAGVALGVDRLIMLATKASSISDVLSFDFSRA